MAGRRTGPILTPAHAPSISHARFHLPAFLPMRRPRRSAMSSIRSEILVRNARTEIAEAALAAISVRHGSDVHPDSRIGRRQLRLAGRAAPRAFPAGAQFAAGASHAVS